MVPLHLYVGEKIQGNFEPKKLNLLLNFQVNCPGCFLYALPTFSKLYKKYNNNLGFLALSTAFEDFDVNTTKNTIDLVNEGTLVGHTKHALAEYGYNKLQIKPEFPIAMDKKMESSQIDEITEKICLLNPNFSIWSNYDQDLFLKKVKNYLVKLPEVSLTFTTNQFRGTPTFTLFNNNEILHSWFGHVKIAEITTKINSFN
ncbi:hypothetical protein [Aquimarina agarivorans]|uniref:hypothetical protein n=1 Tax=Aquimarina agarivorans TaxID=980584 RepID=UPI000248F5C2|nr:hypothetical protein [Aquimarina agarivorans]